MNEAVIDYWHAHYSPQGLCALCGNSGVIDTTGVRTNAGVLVGGKHWCICPNGQTIRQMKAEGLTIDMEKAHAFVKSVEPPK